MHGLGPRSIGHVLILWFKTFEFHDFQLLDPTTVAICNWGVFWRAAVGLIHTVRWSMRVFNSAARERRATTILACASASAFLRR